ncbi:sensory box histidine kinase PhoR [Phytohabitans flavus]|uniref:histidine kinase n=1 Tax=Phytohabitans flavus TaxID=1076124 RepID=A0A6F8Y4G2_9ACTN|nr:two-component sensor histidine kinase [Phytohabitans flavus]
MPPKWRHWTLRSRLVLVVAALSAVALVASNAAGILLLKQYLTDQIDDQLTGMSRMAADPLPPIRVRLSDGFPRGSFDLYRTILIFDAQGNQSPPQGAYVVEISPPEVGSFEELRERAGGEPFTVESADGEDHWRVAVVERPDGGVAVPAVSLRQVDATADLLLVIDLVVMFIVLFLLGLVAASVVRIGLRPLTRMETTSTEITAGDLTRRVDDADPHTESGRLGIALNSMLDRIESEVAARRASEQRIRQFVADASHELRTPLTSIRGFAELYRRGGAPSGPLLDETMSRIEAEAARMGLLVEDLLLLAKLDRQREAQRRPVDLLAIAADTIRDAHARRPDRPVRLASFGGDQCGFEPVTVLGDEHRLRQVATNLVANALQHTPPQADITVRVGRLGGYRPHRSTAAAVGDEPPRRVPVAVLEVADTGPGVPAEHAGRIFERLYRADQSRARRNGGSGLGLSIVAAIVSSHGGRVELETAPGQGSAFRVLLPTGSQSALR